MQREKSVKVYLPGKVNWFDVRSGVAYVGGKFHSLEASDDSIPAFQKAGTIIPRRERFRRSSTQMADDPFTLVHLPWIAIIIILITTTTITS